MKRRDFLLAASGVAGGTAATAAPAGAQQTTTSGGKNQSGGNGTGGNQTTMSGAGNQSSGNQSSGNKSSGNKSSGNKSSGGGGGGGPTKTVKVGPSGSLKFSPSKLTVTPGTTVKWVWESSGHNVKPESQPEGSNWKGTPGGENKLFDKGHTYTHTFNTAGEYSYYCTPHKTAGMTGSITVGAAGSAAVAEADPEEMGVPFQAHYVGIATILMMIMSLLYTFFFLKYGESAHTSGGNR